MQSRKRSTSSASGATPSGVGVEHYCWRFAILGALLTAVVGAVAWWFFNRDSVALDRRLAILVAVGIVFSVANTMAQTRARLAGEPPHVMLVPRLRHIGLMEFNRAAETIAEGRAVVDHALPLLRRYV